MSLLRGNSNLIPHGFFNRSMFDFDDDWFRTPLLSRSTFAPLSTSSLSHTMPSLSLLSPLTKMDLFDPFDELDTMMSRNLQWLNRPDFMRNMPSVPRVPQKYRVTVDIAGYSASSIKTELRDNNRLVVSGSEVTGSEATGDYAKKEFKKTYDLPANVDADKLVSFMAGDNKLIVEVPLKETETTGTKPQIIENVDGSKSVQIKFKIPEKVDPSKINVSVKDRDLIVRIEDKVEKADGVSSFHFYQRTTLPENTQFDQLNCIQENNLLTATAPLIVDPKAQNRQITVEHK